MGSNDTRNSHRPPISPSPSHLHIRRTHTTRALLPAAHPNPPVNASPLSEPLHLLPYPHTHGASVRSSPAPPFAPALTPCGCRALAPHAPAPATAQRPQRSLQPNGSSAATASSRLVRELAGDGGVCAHGSVARQQLALRKVLQQLVGQHQRHHGLHHGHGAVAGQGGGREGGREQGGGMSAASLARMPKLYTVRAPVSCQRRSP